jgi:hypothetical protein
MVEVFKTNIYNGEEAIRIKKLLHILFPESKINFDLEDCDKVLRVEGIFSHEKVIDLITRFDYQCAVLE